MIVRSWTAKTTSANIEAYIRHFREGLEPSLTALPGFLGGTILQRSVEPAGDAGADIELIVITRWESMDAIRGFAGDDVEAAVVEPAAIAVLASYDGRVKHYDVSHDVSAPGSGTRR